MIKKNREKFDSIGKKKIIKFISTLKINE